MSFEYSQRAFNSLTDRQLAITLLSSFMQNPLVHYFKRRTHAVK